MARMETWQTGRLWRAAGASLRHVQLTLDIEDNSDVRAQEIVAQQLNLATNVNLTTLDLYLIVEVTEEPVEFHRLLENVDLGWMSQIFSQITSKHLQRITVYLQVRSWLREVTDLDVALALFTEKLCLHIDHILHKFTKLQKVFFKIPYITFPLSSKITARYRSIWNEKFRAQFPMLNLRNILSADFFTLDTTRQHALCHDRRPGGNSSTFRRNTYLPSFRG
ncbi:hypothetical protein AcV7_002489 [Taiwanofungus camphoratus]|nr:hypothetical protein AcV7_002489 [Antrodia cinnamomea]